MRDRDIAVSKAWFEDLPDKQKAWAENMKELVTNVSFSGLVETVDPLAGEVRDLTKEQYRVLMGHHK